MSQPSPAAAGPSISDVVALSALQQLHQQSTASDTSAGSSSQATSKLPVRKVFKDWQDEALADLADRQQAAVKADAELRKISKDIEVAKQQLDATTKSTSDLHHMIAKKEKDLQESRQRYMELESTLKDCFVDTQLAMARRAAAETLLRTMTWTPIKPTSSLPDACINSGISQQQQPQPSTASGTSARLSSQVIEELPVGRVLNQWQEDASADLAERKKAAATAAKDLSKLCQDLEVAQAKLATINNSTADLQHKIKEAEKDLQESRKQCMDLERELKDSFITTQIMIARHANAETFREKLKSRSVRN